MSENIVVTDKQIYDFLKYTLEISNTIYVDENGFVRRKETGEQIVIGTVNSTEKKPIVLYGSSGISNDVTVLNPFVEGMVKSTESEWYYTVLIMSGINYVRLIQKSLIKLAVQMKKKNNDENDNESDMDLAKVLSKWIDKVDETTLKEYDLLTKKMSDYFNIYYLATKKEARISCGLLTDKDFRTLYKKVRVKTWELLETLTKQLFTTEDFSEFTVVSKIIGCPRYDALLRILYKVYVSLNPYMKYIDDEVKSDMTYTSIDLDYLSKSIDLLDYFRTKAKYLVPTANVSNSNKPTNNQLVNPVNSINPSVAPPMAGMTPVIGNNQMSMNYAPVGNMSTGLIMKMGLPGQSMSTPTNLMNMRPIVQQAPMPVFNNPMFRPMAANMSSANTVNIGPYKN